MNGLSRFCPSDFSNNQFTSVFGTKINDNITAIRDYELVHVTALKSTDTSWAERRCNPTPIASASTTSTIS